MDVALTGISLHVKDVEQSKAFYLNLPGAKLEHEKPGFFASIRLGEGRRINLVRLSRPEDFHIEIGCSNLNELREQLSAKGIEPYGPQPSQWGENGIIIRDPDGNLVEFDDHTA